MEGFVEISKALRFCGLWFPAQVVVVGAGGNGGGAVCVREWSGDSEQNEGWGSGGSSLESNP